MYCIRCKVYVSESRCRFVKVELSADDVEEAFSKFMSFLKKDIYSFERIMDLSLKEL